MCVKWHTPGAQYMLQLCIVNVHIPVAVVSDLFKSRLKETLLSIVADVSGTEILTCSWATPALSEIVTAVSV